MGFREYPRRCALEGVDVSRSQVDLGQEPDGGRSGAHHCDVPSGQIDLMVPTGGAEGGAREGVEAGGRDDGADVRGRRRRLWRGGVGAGARRGLRLPAVRFRLRSALDVAAVLKSPSRRNRCLSDQPRGRRPARYTSRAVVLTARCRSSGSKKDRRWFASLTAAAAKSCSHCQPDTQLHILDSASPRQSAAAPRNHSGGRPLCQWCAAPVIAKSGPTCVPSAPGPDSHR